MEQVGATPEVLDLVVAGVGPGSYTGLRVGAATALGLMRGAGAEVLGLPSFDAVALDGLADGERGAVLRNAFGGHLYVAAYERRGGDVVATSAPACVSPEEAATILNDVPVLMPDEAALRAIGEAAVDGREVRSDARARATDLLDLALLRLASGAEEGFPAQNAARAAWDAAREYALLVQHDQRAMQPLRERTLRAGRHWALVPELDGEIHDLDGLDHVARSIFG